MSTNKPDEVCQPVWIFRFSLEHESGKPVRRTTADALLQSIVKWAEEENLQVGGGYRPPRPEELEPGPIFDTNDGEK